MKKYAVLLPFLAAAILLSKPVIAAPAGEALGTCFTDSLSGKERKQLAQWLFFAMAAHPAIKEFSNVSVENQLSIDQSMAKLFTRLLTINCLSQVRVAVKEAGPKAIENAFGLAGEAAMQELLVNQAVTSSLSGYAKFIDQEKLNSLITEK